MQVVDRLFDPRDKDTAGLIEKFCQEERTEVPELDDLGVLVDLINAVKSSDVPKRLNKKAWVRTSIDIVKSSGASAIPSLVRLYHEV